MATIDKGILILSPFFSPNIGGVETHLDDLVKSLSQYRTYVLTYSPITTPKTPYKILEKHPHLTIVRFPYFGKNLFHTLEKYPSLDFLYLTPYLLITSFIWILLNHSKIDTIHSQGFNAAFVGNLLAKLFNKRHILSTHAVYDHISGFSQKLVIKTLKNIDHILCLSLASQKQLLGWGIDPHKTSVFHYWIDLKSFIPAKTIPHKFTVLYVGRLITKKGIRLLLKVATQIPQVEFYFIGTGPEESLIQKYASRYSNITYFGPIPNHQLPRYFQQASVLCLPSLYREGYGRVVMEAVSSGIPVIASDIGGLRESLNNKVAILIKPTVKNLIQAIQELHHHPKTYRLLRRSCRPYALAKFGPKNIKSITQYY